MKVRAKLSLLVAGNIIALAAALGIYAAILSPISGIERERAYLAELLGGTKDFRAVTSALLIDRIHDASKIFADAVAVYDTCFDDIGKIRLLTKASADLKLAVADVRGLKDILDPGIVNVRDALAQLDQAGNDLYPGAGDMTMLGFFDPPTKKDAKPGDIAYVHYQIASFAAMIQKLEYQLQVTEETIATQDKFIDTAISAIRARSLIIAVSIISFVIVLFLVLSLVMANAIARSIISIGKAMKVMSSGDLTIRLGSGSKDEIGELGKDLDGLLAALNDSFAGIQSASHENRDLGEGLGAAVSEATSSSTEIEANAGSIKKQMNLMGTMVESSLESVDRMNSDILSFSHRIDSQNRMVEDSVAAVTQMMASIESIGRITEKDRESAQSLVSESDSGRIVFQTAFERMSEITESIGAIQEMARVIAGIASQTNLLAMNAAIEAAHAGEAGKGFAVVADEIRKLSEASAGSSKEIARNIREVTAKMRETAATRQETGRAFDSISSRIAEVSRSIAEIYSNVAEVRAGSRLILSSMNELGGQSSEIAKESRGIAGGAEAVRTMIDELSRISREVVSNIGEIALGLGEIAGSVRGVSSRATRITAIGDELDCLINRFRTTKEACPSPDDPEPRLM